MFSFQSSKKKVLVGNNHLSQLGGSEIFTYTIIKAFYELGYKVFFTTHIFGQVGEKCREYATYISPNDIHQEKFEYAFISHTSIALLPIKANKIVQICHSALPGLEEPSLLVDFHVTVSQGASDRLANRGVYSKVIYNPIDLARFKSVNPLNEKPKTILSLCQGSLADQNVELACEKLGIKFLSYSKTRTATWDLEKVINKADIVVSIGRGVWEAMACGRNVIVYDSRSYATNRGDGYITNDIFEKSLSRNSIGAAFEIDFDADSLIKEIDKYNSEQGRKNRLIAEEKFDFHKIALKFLELEIYPNRSFRTSFFDMLSRENRKFIKTKNGNHIFFVRDFFVEHMLSQEHIYTAAKENAIKKYPIVSVDDSYEKILLQSIYK